MTGVTWRQTTAFALSGIAASMAASLMALYFAGPAARDWVGLPADLGTDHTSKAAVLQALLVHTVTAAALFFLLGLTAARWLGSISLRRGLLAANPLCVAAGFCAFRLVVGREQLAEYVGYQPWAYLSIIGWPVFVACVAVGSRAAKTPRGRCVGGAE